MDKQETSAAGLEQIGRIDVCVCACDCLIDGLQTSICVWAECVGVSVRGDGELGKHDWAKYSPLSFRTFQWPTL